MVADVVTAIKMEHAWAVRAIPSRSGLFVWLSFPYIEGLTSSLCSTLTNYKQNLQQELYCRASIYVSPQATIDLRSIICRIMSSNHRLMWDRSAPASPLHSAAMLNNRSTSTLQRGPLLKLPGISSWFVSRLFPRIKGCPCYLSVWNRLCSPRLALIYI